jgi:hypothetical protein
VKAKKPTITSTAGPYLVSRDQVDWRRRRFEEQLADGSLTIRWVCPRCGGDHALKDCPHVIDRAAA